MDKEVYIIENRKVKKGKLIRKRGLFFLIKFEDGTIANLKEHRIYESHEKAEKVRAGLYDEKKVGFVAPWMH